MPAPKLWVNPPNWFARAPGWFGGLDKPNPKLVPPPVEDTREEVLRWGREANFNSEQGAGYGFTIIQDDRNDDEKNNNARPKITYNEISRQTNNVTVTNPEDPDDYVVVQRINTILFSGSDGRDHEFTLKW